ncbi:MAG: hypothetical protein H6727_15440 [Myxococcales bacterium]|nr:hypothetical protein [Myxococcales bacterium]
MRNASRCQRRVKAAVLSWIGFWCFGCFFGWGASLGWAQSSPSSACSEKMKRGQWKDAASCFLALVDAIPKDTKDLFSKKQKALYLKYTAQCYGNYAKAQEGASQRAYYYELAAAQLRRYLDEKLCDKVYQCRNTRGLLQEYESKIGYATLVFAAGTKPVTVKVAGFQFDKTITVNGQLSQKLRPGPYTLVIQEEGGASKQDSVVLTPSQTKLLRVGTAPVLIRKVFVKSPAKGPALGSYILMGIGGGLILIGAGMGIGTYVKSGSVADEIDNTISRLKEDPKGFNTKENQDKARDLVDELDLLDTLNVSGWVVLGAGGAVFVGGLIWMLATLPKAPPKVSAGPSFPHRARATLLWSSMTQQVGEN